MKKEKEKMAKVVLSVPETELARFLKALDKFCGNEFNLKISTTGGKTK